MYSVDIKIDGVLDEEDWSSAREWTKYYESMPFSLAEPKHYQKVLVQQDEKGMYFGFINWLDSKITNAVSALLNVAILETKSSN